MNVAVLKQLHCLKMIAHGHISNAFRCKCMWWHPIPPDSCVITQKRVKKSFRIIDAPKWCIVMKFLTAERVSIIEMYHRLQNVISRSVCHADWSVFFRFSDGVGIFVVEEEHMSILLVNTAFFTTKPPKSYKCRIAWPILRALNSCHQGLCFTGTHFFHC